MRSERCEVTLQVALPLALTDLCSAVGDGHTVVGEEIVPPLGAGLTVAV